MKSSNKQVVQYNIYSTGNCYKIHGAFGIPQPTKNGADNINAVINGIPIKHIVR